MSMNIKIKEFAYHRNGVAGESFHVFKFKQGKDNMIGVLFDKPGQCAVFDVDLLAKGEIRFAHNSWRGDDYEPEFRRVLREEAISLKDLQCA